MNGAPVDAQERLQLCDLFLELGPGAPTLCEGWATLDLAAHLFVRENDVVRSGPAILGGARFKGLEARLMDAAKAQGLEALVAKLRTGPPSIPWRLPGLRRPLNLIEWFVHHEDARRANGRPPRGEVPDLDRELWAQFRQARLLLLMRVRSIDVELVAPGHGSILGKGRKPHVRLAGSPQELVLYLYGRRSAADVELSGDPDAITTLETARLGI